MRGKKKEETLRRLKTSVGHLRAVEQMVAEDRYCADILLQLAAVIASLKKISNIILENHLETCLRAAMRRCVEEEVISVLKTFLKFKI